MLCIDEGPEDEAPAAQDAAAASSATDPRLARKRKTSSRDEVGAGNRRSPASAADEGLQPRRPSGDVENKEQEPATKKLKGVEDGDGAGAELVLSEKDRRMLENLPPAQRELFLRIKRQQQHEASLGLAANPSASESRVSFRQYPLTSYFWTVPNAWTTCPKLAKTAWLK